MIILIPTTTPTTTTTTNTTTKHDNNDSNRDSHSNTNNEHNIDRWPREHLRGADPQPGPGSLPGRPLAGAGAGIHMV